jgi:4-alpha-glucanotransferase
VNDVTVSELSSELLDLAAAYGVATEYDDWRGNHVKVAPETITAILAAMDVDASTPDATKAALRAQCESRWRRMLPASVVVTEGSATQFWVHVPHGDPVEVWVELETGDERDGLRQVDKSVEPAEIDGSLVGEATFELPDDLPLGYHLLNARSGATTASSTLIVTPPWLGLPERMGTRQAWGFANPL